MAKLVAPKYISDTLTPWCGYWVISAYTSISYSALPVGDALAKIVMSRPDAGGLNCGFNFNGKNNLNDYAVDFYIRSTVNPAGNTLWLVSPSYNWQIRAPLGVMPANWTKFSLQIPSQFVNYAGAFPQGKSYTASLMSNLYFEVTAGVGGCTYEVSGMTFRRL